MDFRHYGTLHTPLLAAFGYELISNFFWRTDVSMV